MGGDSCSEGREFKVQTPAPYTGWTFFTLIRSKNCNICLKKTKNKLKRGVVHF